VTDRIRSIEADGIALESGARLPADAIVTATGLRLLALGGIEINVDGARLETAGRMAYRGMMLDGVPNLAFCIGYTNASWTLRADLVARFVCRLLRYMRRHDFASCRPRRDARAAAGGPLLNLNSGYIKRAAGALPEQGDREPWRLHQQHVREWLSLRLGRLGSGALDFRSTDAAPGGAVVVPATRAAEHRAS
jgi:cation diffusion facilitator CzcD-associated flavoprotein CzcO